MKIKQLSLKSLLIAILLTGFSYQVSCQTNYTFQSGEMTIAGTSTLHDWVSDVTQINFKGSIQTESTALSSIKNVHLTIPVEGIKSTKGRGMDNKTYKALESEEHPNITCSLSSFDIKKTSKQFNITANGKLIIAGTTKPLLLNFTGQFTDQGNLRFTGSKALKMTDFNIDPPRALLGTLKTGDDITIEFTVLMKPTDATANTK